MNISPKGNDRLEVDFNSYVKRIEVEKVIDDSADEPWPKSYRTIRFTTHSGEVLVVNCDSDAPEDLELVEVDQLEPVAQPKPDKRDWLAPKPSKKRARKRAGTSPARNLPVRARSGLQGQGPARRARSRSDLRSNP